MKLLLFIALIPVALLAQQGSGARALLATSAAVAAPVTNAPKFLTWDSAATKFAVHVGTNRASLVRKSVISTNRYQIASGSVYGIRAIDAAGMESAPAYWPSNRIGELWTQFSTNLVGWQDSQRLERFTNSAKQPAMFLRVVDKTVGWLPPN